MRYFVSVGGRPFVVDVAAGKVVVDGRELLAELRAVPGTAMRHLLLDGRSYPLIAAPRPQGGGWDLHMAGERLEVDAVDERTRTIREMTARNAGPRGPRPVRAPMPGLIVRLEVATGQHVQSGQSVAIIEAMKMENELRAEGAGVVARVLVHAGQVVEKGAVLVEFEEAAA
jgi:pyruvate carboxylase subunit B